MLRLVDGGLLDLAAPVGFYLPGFRGGHKPAVTVRMLLAHTSGAPGGINVTRRPDVAARRDPDDSRSASILRRQLPLPRQ